MAPVTRSVAAAAGGIDEANAAQEANPQMPAAQAVVAYQQQQYLDRRYSRLTRAQQQERRAKYTKGFKPGAGYFIFRVYNVDPNTIIVWFLKGRFRYVYYNVTTNIYRDLLDAWLDEDKSLGRTYNTLVRRVYGPDKFCRVKGPGMRRAMRGLAVNNCLAL